MIFMDEDHVSQLFGFVWGIRKFDTHASITPPINYGLLIVLDLLLRIIYIVEATKPETAETQ